MKILISICTFLVLAICRDALAGVDQFRDDSFSLMDSDGNKLITKDEFLSFFRKMDYSGDTKVNASEFIRGYEEAGADYSDSLYTFFRFDYTHDNEIDKAEQAQIFAVMDVDKDEALNYVEYASSVNTLGTQVKLMQRIGAGVERIFDSADKKQTGFLTADDMLSILAKADTDDSGRISEEEFVSNWRNVTGDNADRSTRLFKIINYNATTDFGSDEEKKGLFEAFDYSHDGVVTRVEFLNAMTAIFARVMDSYDTDAFTQLAPSNINLTVIFVSMDSNGDGISLEEYMNAGKQEDLDGDGYLNYTEFMTPQIRSGIAPKASLFSFFHTDLDHSGSIDEHEIRTSYHVMDRNSDKKVTLAELEFSLLSFKYLTNLAAAAAPRILAMLAIADQNGDDILNGVETWAVVMAADKNADGVLAKDEFAKYWSTNSGLSERVSQDLFDIFDGNRDGAIEEPERAAIYQMLDYDHDGFVSFDEFMNAMLYSFELITTKISEEIRNNMRSKFDINTNFVLLDMDNSGYIEIQEYEKAFVYVDANHDGSIEYYESAKSLPSISPNGATYLFYLNDHNGDGKITRDEYIIGFEYSDLDDDNRMSKQEHEKVWQSLLYQFGEVSMALDRFEKLFAVVDANKDNFIDEKELTAFASRLDTNDDRALTTDELRNVMVSQVGVAEERADILVKMYDTNSDGKIDASEQKTVFDSVSKGKDMITMDDFTDDILKKYGQIFGLLDYKKLEDTKKKHGAWMKAHPDAVVG
ncbi:uncharacterized protein [Watersipora subatra]|uniref:uncharacterized protein n=1 Tax=Watersipora subatra TaxID=2589382 RepID=UPI00355BF706